MSSGRLPGVRAGYPPSELGEITLGLAQLRGDLLRVPGQESASYGQRHLPAGTVDQAGSGFPFQGYELLGDRRRSQMQCLRGAATLPLAATA